MIRGIPLAVALAVAGAGAAAGQDRPAETVAITGGTVYTMVPGEKPIVGGTVVIADGRIVAAGAGVAVPAGARVIKADGAWVLPGFCDASTMLGLVEIEMVEASRDTHEKGAVIQPHLRVLDAFNAESEVIPVQRVNGITHVLVAPEARNVVSGQSALLHLDRARPEQFLIRAPVAVHAALGEASRREGTAAPTTRMGVVALLRKSLIAAQEYQRKLEKHAATLAERARKRAAGEKVEGDDPEPPATDLEKSAWGPVLSGEIPMITVAQRASDIAEAIAIGKEFGIRIVVEGGADSWKLAAELAEAKVPVLYGPVTQQPDRPETAGAVYETAAKLHAAGVVFALTTRDTHNVRNLPYEAGLAVAAGLPGDAALAAITRVPAEILGAGDQIGTLAAGRLANVVVWTGDPFQPRSTVKALFIRGREIALVNKQTALRDRYK